MRQLARAVLIRAPAGSFRKGNFALMETVNCVKFRMKPVKPVSLKEAYKRGKHYAINGANEYNCHISIFLNLETTKEWQRGYEENRKQECILLFHSKLQADSYEKASKKLKLKCKVEQKGSDYEFTVFFNKSQELIHLGKTAWTILNTI